MSAVNDSLSRLTISLHMLRTAIDECDASRRLPANPPEPLKSIAEELCSDADMVDIEAAVHFMDRISAQCRVRSRHINRITESIKKATGEVKT
jgi:hypothetical protein